MRNVWNVARKEYADLVHSRMNLIVLVAFLLYSLMVIYKFYEGVNDMVPGGKLRFYDNLGLAGDNFLFISLGFFGAVIGIIIGCSSISSERVGHALNTLTTKPVHRTTIINGKLLGMLLFLLSIMAVFTVLFTVMYLLFCGSAIVPHLSEYLFRLPFVIFVALVYVLVFLTMSMLISLVVRNQAFALILSAVFLYAVEEMGMLGQYLDMALPGHGFYAFFVKLSPKDLIAFGMDSVQNRLMDTSSGAVDAFMSTLPELSQLLVYVAILLGLGYVIFTRRDIS